jgi:hypothetical protein
MPTAGVGNRWSQRLPVVRCFATHLHALDPAHEIPPADILARRTRRAAYLYTEQQILALMIAIGRLRGHLRRATYRTLFGLLAVTVNRARLESPTSSLIGSPHAGVVRRVGGHHGLGDRSAPSRTLTCVASTQRYRVGAIPWAGAGQVDLLIQRPADR